jgi:excisionase family DNA binding protein
VKNGRKELLTVGQACRYVGVSRMTLLAAESAGLLAPARTPGGHRRYQVRDLDGLLTTRATPPPAAEPTPRPPDRGHRDPALAEAVRQLVLLLKADSAALYEVDDHALVLRQSFGMPRWLTDQLEQRVPPEPVLQALATRRELQFDAADCFPRPTPSGQGLAVPVLHGEEALGVLAVLGGRGRIFLGSEHDILRTAAIYLSLLLEQQRVLASLSTRLREVHRLSTTKGTSHA